MSVPIYKVIFKGIEESEGGKLNLIFKGSKSDSKIKIPSHFILELKEISKSNHQRRLGSQVIARSFLGKPSCAGH